MIQKPVIIKKYANRRLYDTQTSSYVTLQDLCTMVKQGQQFTVQDAKSGEDLTRAILTQIIFEQESKGYNLLPINFLRQIITFYDDNLGVVLPGYLEHAMEQFCNQQDVMRNYMNSMAEFTPLKAIEDMRQQQQEWFGQTMQLWNPFFPHTTEDSTPSTEDKDS